MRAIPGFGSQTAPNVAPAGAPGFERSLALNALASQTFDLVVIGGGITGAGVALDAASRGLRTALVERRDLASGTSSRSSKLVHGGLRYLQQHEFGLVYESLAERQRLMDNAAHLVTPLPFLIPLLGSGGVVNKTVAKTYSTALWLYDLTGGLRIGRRHRRVEKEEVIAHFPTLRADRLAAGFLYYDARTDDARLTLAIARTAAIQFGAVVANYAEVTALLPKDGRLVSGALVQASPLLGQGSQESTTRHSDDDPIEIRCRAIVNAAGIWADEIRALDEGVHPSSIRPAKGIHLTVPASKLPCDIAAVLPVPGDRRSIFVIPWGDRTYLGTTDTDYDGPLDEPSCTPADVQYLLSAVNAATTSPLSPDDITAAWAGLRPLLAPQGQRKLSARTADLSRRHTVTVSNRGLITVTGGKLTTYRKMAEDTVDVVVERLGRGSRRSPTRRLTIEGSPQKPQKTRWMPAAVYRQSKILHSSKVPLVPPPKQSYVEDHLWSRYGLEAQRVWGLVLERPDLAQPLVPGLPYLYCEAVYAIRNEMALGLDDLLSRRTRCLLLDANLTVQAAGEIARTLACEWGWTPEEAAERATDFADQAQRFLAAAKVGVEQDSSMRAERAGVAKQP
ncbi:MAG: glycerol-3-phosphate dehydrogenase/oxidase [Actinobacteria bacterium]|nr:glycerol-3-phosphate dehydrogenase/oxidase [Actinomycetota bacterium]